MSTGYQAADLAGRLVVAGAFTLAAVLKLADLPGLRATLYLSRITRPWVPQLTIALPLVELACAVGLLGERSGWPASVLVVAVLLAFIAFLAADRTAGEGCNCFGRRGGSSRRAGVVRDVVLIAILAPTLAAGPAGPRRGIPPQAEPWAAGVAVVAVAVLLAWAVRRDRRLRRATADRGRRRAGRPGRPVAPTGPARGRVAPDFDLPAVAGGRLRLAERLALAHPAAAWTPVVFVQPGCSSCAGLLEQLAGHPTVLVVASGDGEQVSALARRYRLPGVGIDLDGAVADAYRVRATPSACLLDPDGAFRDATGARTERLSVGPDAVTALLDAASRRS
jgi:hypothetical protein